MGLPNHANSGLKLNADKTEVLHFTSKFRQSHQLQSLEASKYYMMQLPPTDESFLYQFYIFNPKAFSNQFTVSKEIDAESPIVISWGTIGL